MKLRHDSVRVLNHPVKVKNEENTNFNVVELNSSIIKDSLSSLNNKTNDLNVNGCSQIHLLADPNAVPFYHSKGFVIIDEKESVVFGRFLPVMQKKLTV